MTPAEARRFLADAFARSPWARQRYLSMSDADALARVERVEQLAHPQSFMPAFVPMARKD